MSELHHSLHVFGPYVDEIVFFSKEHFVTSVNIYKVEDFSIFCFEQHVAKKNHSLMRGKVWRFRIRDLL